MALRLGKVDLDQSKIPTAFNTIAAQAVMLEKAEQIKGLAILIFESHVRHTHPITPPPYVTSFKVQRNRKFLMEGFRVTNTDPQAFFVEFGAYIHHPTHPKILAYHPLTRAIDIVSTLE